MTYTVYKHTSPSGKVYIGITCQRPEARWGRDGEGYKHSPHLMAAIKKYGWAAFRHDILAEGLTKDTAERIEIDLIEAHHSTDRRFGYNTDRGGSMGAKHSAETKRKIGEANRARVWTPEARQKISEYRRAHPVSIETARRISDANRGRKHRPESVEKIRAAAPKRPVRNLTTGETFQSVQDAARAYKLDPSKIVKVCRGKRSGHGGYRWAYEEVIA